MIIIGVIFVFCALASAASADIQTRASLRRTVLWARAACATYSVATVAVAAWMVYAGYVQHNFAGQQVGTYGTLLWLIALAAGLSRGPRDMPALDGGVALVAPEPHIVKLAQSDRLAAIAA